MQKNTFKNRWDTINLFTDLGLIGRGLGAGQLWFLDGTQMDCWVTYNGKPVQIYYMLVRCAITGYPLLVYPIRSESTETIIKMVATAYEMYGVPRYGFMLDNSSAFRSRPLYGFLRSLYTDADLAEFDEHRHPIQQIFRGGPEHGQALSPRDQHRPPLWYSPPYIPTAPIKAAGERAFREFGRHQSRELAESWQQSPEVRSRTERGNTLAPLWRAAIEAEPAFAAFHEWIYTHYINQIRSGHLDRYRRIARSEGLPLADQRPTILNAWRYYGGEAIDRKLAPEEKAAERYYWMVPDSRQYRHRVTVGYAGGIGSVQHHNEMYNYMLPELSDLHGRQVCVVPDLAEPRRAYVYLEHDPAAFDERVSADMPLHYIGEAVDHTIRTAEDLHLVESRRANQRIQEERLNGHIKAATPTAPVVERRLPETPAASLMPKNHEQLIEYSDFEGIQAPARDIHDNPRPLDSTPPPSPRYDDDDDDEYEDSFNNIYANLQL